MKDIKIGTPVTYCSGSDRYAYYVVGISKINKNGDIRELQIARAKIGKGNPYDGYYEVKPFEEGTEGTIRTIKATRKDPDVFTRDGRYDSFRYALGVAVEYYDL